jgi:putative Mg2+ transporter-C (MgtC) family protein
MSMTMTLSGWVIGAAGQGAGPGQVVSTLREEFADLSDPAQLTRVSVRLFIAVLLGAVLGFERERSGRSAGLRTHMMVALGVALVVVAAQISGIGPGDMSRVLQGLLAGVGFLGAGAIIKQTEKEQVKGLTTAASLWAVAAIAVAAGLGREATAILATALAFVILSVLRRVERRLLKKAGSRAGDAGDAPGRDDGGDAAAG